VPLEDLLAFVAAAPPDAIAPLVEPRELPTSLFGDTEA
jgi:hypothetical protein